MTREELDDLRRRFGKDSRAWPAPYRQMADEAGGPAAIEDDAEHRVDRRVLEAVYVRTDEAALAAQVLQRIGDRRFSWWSAAINGLLRTPSAAVCAGLLLLIAAGMSGYATAGLVVPGGEDILLSLALGEGFFDLATGAPGQEVVR